MAQDSTPQNPPPKDQQKEHKGRGPGMQSDHFPSMKGLDLTADQKSKVKELRKEYKPKFEDLRKAREAIFTAEQKKARDEAADKAKEAGKNRWEIGRAGRDAMKITDEQKTKLGEIRTKVRAALQRGHRQGEGDPHRRAEGQTRRAAEHGKRRHHEQEKAA